MTEKTLSAGFAGPPAGSSRVEQPVVVDTASSRSDELERAAERVRSRLKAMSADIIEIGCELRDVKQRMGYGHFLEWVEKQCGLSSRLAQLMMKAAEWAEGKREIVSHLEPTAIYLLAAPSTPETVRQDVLSRLEEGQTPATQLVKDMIRATKDQRARRSNNGQRGPFGQQHDSRHVQPQLETHVGEAQKLLDGDPIGSEQAFATNELLEMLLAWDRFDDFMALLNRTDLPSVVRALKDRSYGCNAGAKISVTGQTPLVSPEADDKTGEARPLPLEVASAEMALRDRVDTDVEAPSVIAAPDPSNGASAEELLAILSHLKPTTQWYGRYAIDTGTLHPQEHHHITKALAQFRAAASNASPAERQRFLEITASLQLAGHAEEVA